MWRSCREEEKRVEGLLRADYKKRHERKKAYFATKFADPLLSLRAIGLPEKVHTDTAHFQLIERGDNLMCWKSNSEILIDRFDGRALLDQIPTPSSTADEDTE